MSAELIGILGVGVALAGFIRWQVKDLRDDHNSLRSEIRGFRSEVSVWRSEISTWQQETGERVAKLEVRSDPTGARSPQGEGT